MKTKIAKTLALTLVAIIMLCIFSGCSVSPEKKIIGTWRLSSVNSEETLDDYRYPGDTMVFAENGDCKCQGLSASYILDDDVLICHFWGYEYKYYIKFQGNQMLLKDFRDVEKDANAPWIYFDKVS